MNCDHSVYELDLARIELASPQCECGVLPLYYKPATSAGRMRCFIIALQY